MRSILALLSIVSWINLTMASHHRPAFSPRTLPATSHNPDSTIRELPARNIVCASILPRGGSMDDEESDDDQEYNNHESAEFKECSSSIDSHRPNNKRSVRRHSVIIATLSTTILSKLYPAYVSVMGRMKRGIVAGWEAAIASTVQDSTQLNVVVVDDDDQKKRGSDGMVPKLHSLLGKTGYVCMEIYRGVVSDDSVSDDSSRCLNDTRIKKRRHHRSRYETLTTKPTSIANGGAIEENTITSLSSKYGIETNPNHHPSILLFNTLSEALQKANTDARFLICYISSSSQDDAKVIPAVLDAQFTKLMQRKPLGKKNLEDTGSYYLWICPESERDAALKRLKMMKHTINKKKTTILSILYPATAIDSSGKLRTSPKLLTQHHCNPPPSSVDSLKAWITSTRKRHIREYAKLQHDRKERTLYKERSEGYKQSIVQDGVKEQKEKEELEKKRMEEEAELKRLKEIQNRREELLENLPMEPESSENSITVALRFHQNVVSKGGGDGEATTRRFKKSDGMNDVFNWIDAVHGLERERIRLSTMNGSKSFVYDDEEEGGATLEEAGLGKMTALRVAEIEPDDKAAGLESEE